MKKVIRFIGLFQSVLIILGFICTPVYLIYRNVSPVAEFVNRYISAPIRIVQAFITDFFTFSIAEILILAIPIIIFAIVLFVSNNRKNPQKIYRLIFTVVALVSFVWVTFVTVYAPAYFTEDFEERLDLETDNITTDDLKSTLIYLANELNGIVSENEFPTSKYGKTFMSESMNDISDKICDSYAQIKETELPFITGLRSDAKPIVLSHYMTYTHISGIYTYYTGEVNINTNYPDYIVVSTIAHEMAHQRGVAREDEASFTAYLVLSECEDPYLRYSGLLDVYTTVENDLYMSDTDAYKQLYGLLDERIRAELKAYSDFFDEYRENKAADISEKVNDEYLKSQGTDGAIDYSNVSKLVCAYCRKHGWK